MKNTPLSTEAVHQYATAYEAHYTTKDLKKAFVIYGRVMAEHPDAPEADYSRSQVQNIVNAVVPKQKITDALVQLARVHFEQDVPSDVN